MFVLYNRIGLQYFIYDTGVNKCTIRHKDKMLHLEQPSVRVITAWHNWQGKGLNVQEAFPFLNADEREFLLTGLTAEEFDKITSDISDMFYEEDDHEY